MRFIKGVYGTKTGTAKQGAEMEDKIRNDENGTESADAENLLKCGWCGEALPEDELLKEADLGRICRRCADALRSRGEKLVIEDE